MRKLRKPVFLTAAGICIALFLPPVHAQQPESDIVRSLIFSDAGRRAISDAVAMRPSEITLMTGGGVPGMAPQPENQPDWRIQRLTLSALVYTDPQNWTLWFGGRRVERGNVPPYLSDLRVAPNYVDLSVIASPGAAPIPVRLRPHQTFLIGQLRIAGSGEAGN
jgi:hypothetical protein